MKKIKSSSEHRRSFHIKTCLASLLLCFVMLFVNTGFSNVISAASEYVSEHLIVSNKVAMSDSFDDGSKPSANQSKQVSKASVAADKNITLDFCGGEKGNGEEKSTSETIVARNDVAQELSTPTLENHVFYGYFSGTNASGEKFYDYLGNLVDGVTLGESTPNTLYAAWVRTTSTVHTSDGERQINEENGVVNSAYRYVGLDIAKLKEVGFKTVKVNLDVAVRAQDKGDGRYVGFHLLTKDSAVFERNILDNADLQYTEWKDTYASVEIELEKLNKDSKFRFSFLQDKRYFWTNAIWWFRDAYCHFSAADRTVADPLKTDYARLNTASYRLADNSGYNVGESKPNGNPLGGNYADIGLNFCGGQSHRGRRCQRRSSIRL